jgi:hypothetical protein
VLLLSFRLATFLPPNYLFVLFSQHYAGITKGMIYSPTARDVRPTTIPKPSLHKTPIRDPKSRSLLLPTRLFLFSLFLYFSRILDQGTNCVLRMAVFVTSCSSASVSKFIGKPSGHPRSGSPFIYAQSPYDTDTTLLLHS